MALPTAYLTSTKNLPDILDAITSAEAPSKFTQGFLEQLGFASKSDRLIINVLKAIGFLTAAGEPTERYFRFLDPTQSKRVLAEGIREAYGDLFAIKTDANRLPRNELKGKIKVLNQGKGSDSVLDKMAMTFEALAKQADFSGSTTPPKDPPRDRSSATDGGGDEDGLAGTDQDSAPSRLQLGGLVYNVQLQLPESRDPAVYDALFKSLRAHLLK
jgi:hypothetical protein